MELSFSCLDRKVVLEMEMCLVKHLQQKGIKVNPQEQSIVISRRKIMEEDKKEKEIINSILQNDDVLEGVVKKITTYGMFVDVGGVDGLVHYSEISYKVQLILKLYIKKR